MTATTPTPPCLGEREAVARTGETAWTSYAIARPETAGTYRWRVPSRAVKDLIVTFLAENRTRGAGFETVISPAFDHWNGYSVSVPSGTEWKPAEQPEAKPRESYRCVEVENLAAAEPCPFCQKRPAIDGNAPWMCAGPHEWHEWYLRCCGMVRASTYRDPRLAVAAWNSALSNPLRTENETLRAALAQALRFVDRAAGEGLCFTEGDHGEQATDAADVCCAVARTLGIDLDSDEFCALTTPEHPHGD